MVSKRSRVGMTAGRLEALPAMLGLGVGLLAGCLQVDAFACVEDSQCMLDGNAGRCVLAEQTCVYPNNTCTTQWSTAAGDCVLSPGVIGTSGDSSAVEPSEGTDEPDPDSGGSLPVDGSSTGPDDGATTSAAETTTGVPGGCPGPTDDITALGVVSATSVFSDDYFPPLSVDGNFASSWFSSGPEDGNEPTFYQWSDLESHCISHITITGNGLHSNPSFRTGFGFEHMIIRLYDGSDAVVFEEMFDLNGTPDPTVTVEPNVEGMRIELELFDHEANNCGGFSELQVVGD